MCVADTYNRSDNWHARETWVKMIFDAENQYKENISDQKFEPSCFIVLQIYC